MHINHTFQITQQDFEKLKHNENVLLKCEVCSEQYYRTKHSITSKYKLKGVFPRFCSRTCHSNSMKREDVNCQHCMQSFKPKKSTTKKFCSSSCSASFNNMHKTYGIRRSKLEYYLEENLIKLYPDLIINFCNKEVIGSELDIYIPSLKLAFEIQGIFHYEPIYGEEKLKQIQKNDNLKLKNCLSFGIKLIQIKAIEKFTKKSSLCHLNTIIEILRSQPRVLTN